MDFWEENIEWLFLSLLALIGVIYFYLFTAGKKSGNNKKSRTSYSLAWGEDSSESSKKSDPKMNVLEVFDYNGIKILHENGIYTVNHGGDIQVYGSWAELPRRYQAMVKEMDDRSQKKGSKKGNYFLEIRNGLYFVTMPDGKKKKYNSYTDIPESIRKSIKES